MNIHQLLASDPSTSSWVSASAGTGKTKVLTDRVLRLLLSGVKFKKILCLTFTNAAANEMLERVTNQLKAWVYISDNDLFFSLYNILGKSPNKSEIKLARSLCKEYLKEKEGIAIQTIHGFCQSLLQKFPIEAGINPNFTILDEFKIKEVIYFIQHNFICHIDELQESLKFIASYKYENTISKIIADIIIDQYKFFTLFKDYPTAEVYKEFLTHYLNVNKNNKEKIIREFFKKFSACPSENCIDQTKENINDNKFFTNLTTYKKLKKEELLENFSQITNLFLTNTGLKRKNLVSKSFKKRHPNVDEYLSFLQEEILQLQDKLYSLKIIESTYHLYKISIAVLQAYQDYKLTTNCFDYNDLIHYTHKLLSSSDTKDWVLYKLDRTIDHILIDEAQDNSQNQWNIILIMLEDLLSGISSCNSNSTFFVVGDKKQSIYSFQGANASIFNSLSKELSNNFNIAQKPFKHINLDISYRSTQAILDIVQIVFEDIAVKIPKLFIPGDLTKLKCKRSNAFGRVELWDIVTSKYNDTKEMFWPITTDISTETHGSYLLAKQIAYYINQVILSKKVLPSTKQQVSYKDFLILVRRRNEFVDQLIHELKQLNLKVSGIDRVSLQDHLSILDIMSLARFLVTPYDDLNLSALLKSPFINCREEDIYFLCVNKKKRTIFGNF